MAPHKEQKTTLSSTNELIIPLISHLSVFIITYLTVTHDTTYTLVAVFAVRLFAWCVEVLRSRSLSSSVIMAVLKSFGMVLLTAVVLYIVMLLLGTPLTSYIEKSIRLALYLSISLFLPLYLSSFNIGGDLSIVRQVVFMADGTDLSPQLVSMFRYAFWYGFVGAYFGACAMVLDWQRDWLYWPLPVMYASSLSACIGAFIAIFRHSKVLFKSRPKAKPASKSQ